MLVVDRAVLSLVFINVIEAGLGSSSSHEKNILSDFEARSFQC